MQVCSGLSLTSSYSAKAPFSNKTIYLVVLHAHSNIYGSQNCALYFIANALQSETTTVT